MAAARPLCALLVLLLCALAAGPAAAAPGGFEGAAPLGDDALAALRAGAAFRVVLPTRAGEVAAEFAPVGVLADSYAAEQASARGSRRGARRPAVATFSGRVAPDSGLRDFAKLSHLPGGRVSGLLRVEGVLYDLAADLARGDFLLGVREITPEALAGVVAGCGVATPPPGGEARAGDGSAAGGAGDAPDTASASALREIELATEADAPFVALSGGADSANARILAVVNAINGIYEADLGLTNRVVYQRAWTGSDPYTTSDSSTLLSQFRSRFSSDVASVYDDAQLFSGRDFESNVIGRAWIAATCTSYRFGVNQGLGLDDGALRLLVAHEAGHNHGANHDTSGIMTALLDPSVTWFSEHSRGEIGSFLDTTGCIADAPGSSAPVLADPADRSVRVGDAVRIALVASDADGDPLAFSAVPLPAGASLSAAGVFAWTPTSAQVGSWVIAFSATDPGGLSATQQVKLTVRSRSGKKR